MAGALIIAPMFAYPVFLMKALCFALFACAFNLLIGYVGLLSFGHALFFGWASYVGAHAAKVWGFPPELAILSGTATGAGADDVFLRHPSAVHSRRGRHPGSAARKAVRVHRPRGPDQHVRHRAGHLPRLFPADLSDHQFALRRGAQGDTRERGARGLTRL